MLHFLSGQRNVHILNGGLEFGAGFVPLTTMHPHTTYRLTSVKLAVTSDVEKDVADPDGIRILLISSTLESSFILEDCIFETALDTPAMSRLLACTASDGGQVRPQTAVMTRTCNCFSAAVACSSCHLLHRQTLHCLACLMCSAIPADFDDQLQVSRVQACCGSLGSVQGGHEGMPCGLDHEGHLWRRCQRECSGK
jgi:hypothetical protein